METKTIERKKLDDLRESLLFDVPLYVRDSQGRFAVRFGRLGIDGFYFETDQIPLLGQVVQVKLVLLGLGEEVEAQGRILGVAACSSHVGVCAVFEDIPFEVERIIARWLDMLNYAHQVAPSACVA